MNKRGKRNKQNVWKIVTEILVIISIIILGYLYQNIEIV